MKISFKYISYFILVVVGFIIYSNVLHGPFQFDDYEFVLYNKNIRNITDFKAIANCLSQPSRFVTFFSFALNYHFNQYESFYYHVTNWVIHVLNSILVWNFILLIFRTPLIINQPPRLNKIIQNKYLIALSASLIFLVHPAQTQAVSYITQRFSSLATFFYLSSVVFYLLAKLKSEQRLIAGAFFLGAGLTAILGMFTKEILITLPIMIIFIEMFLFKSFRFSKTHLIIGSLLLIIPSIFSFRIKDVIFSPIDSASHHGDIITFFSYIWTQFKVLATLLKVYFFPFYQNLDYDFQLVKTLFDLSTVFSFGLVVFILITAFLYRKKNALLSLGLFWTLLTYLPEFIPRQHIIFEHKLYLPSVGLSLVLCIILFDSTKSVKKFLVIITVIVVTFSYLTIQRNKIWNNEVLLWEDVVKKSSQKSRGYIHLGYGYFNAGNYQQAVDVFNRLLTVYPDNRKGLNNRGAAYLELGRYDLALKDFERLQIIDPDNISAYQNKSSIYIRQKKYDLALEEFNKAISRNPHNIDLYKRRAEIYDLISQSDLALADLNRALEMEPNDVETINNIGIIYLKKSDLQNSLKYFNKTIELDSNFVQGYLNRGQVYQMLKKTDKAIDDYSKTIMLSPSSAIVYLMRAKSYYQLQEYRKSLDDLNTAKNLGQAVDSRYFEAVQKLIK